jgi:hypothetical protein
MSICGIGLFGTLTAYIAQHFIAPSNEKEENEIAELKKEIIALQKQMESLLARNNDTTFSRPLPINGNKENIESNPLN